MLLYKIFHNAHKKVYWPADMDLTYDKYLDKVSTPIVQSDFFMLDC